jgi:hypothetical protein
VLRPVALLLSLTGCRILSLPPASSRSDGGPVASRGVISHEARSQVRLYRDAAGCESVQTLNRQFRLVTVAARSGTHRLVLEEAYDLRHCLARGGSSSEATITAWHPDSNPASPPAFRIETRATSGAPVGNLYRFESVGCCGSGTIGTFYSLLTGRLLFASSLRPLALGGEPGAPGRFIAFHDTFSAIAPVEAADSGVIGVLETADDSVPRQRLALVADPAEPFALDQLVFWKDRRAVDDSVVSDPVRGLAVAVTLRAPGSGRRVRVVVPIVGDSLDRSRADLPAGFSFRPPRDR